MVSSSKGVESQKSDRENIFFYGESKIELLRKTKVFSKLIQRYGNDVDFYKPATCIGVRFFEGKLSFQITKSNGEREIIFAEDLALEEKVIFQLKEAIQAEKIKLKIITVPGVMSKAMDTIKRLVAHYISSSRQK